MSGHVPRALLFALLAALAAAACPAASKQGEERVADSSAPGGDARQPVADSASTPDTSLSRGRAPVAGERAATESRTGVAPDTARGTVAVVGADPFTAVILQTAEGEIALDGPLTNELETLHGAQLSVTGTEHRLTESGGGRSRFAVAGYTIESIGGEKPVVGILSIRDDSVWVGSTRLAAVPREFLELAGAKVWVTGAWEENATLYVAAYGVLRRMR